MFPLGYYKLDEDGRTPVACNTMEWARNNPVRVALWEDGTVAVSTVFLGLDHNRSSVGPPILFETMTFNGTESGDCERCATWDEAMAIHERAIRKAKGESHDDA